MSEIAKKCNRCGSILEGDICKNCYRIDSIYCFCNDCGRYAMHYRNGKKCIVCMKKITIKSEEIK